mmetsp:Transcript_6601/g.17663  ORF Transcript_6601/g.17663 Transcript_6601/m.17663 type:complete len:258 (-) Transcript_6601:1403-2176(-)
MEIENRAEGVHHSLVPIHVARHLELHRGGAIRARHSRRFPHGRGLDGRPSDAPLRPRPLGVQLRVRRVPLPGERHILHRLDPLGADPSSGRAPLRFRPGAVVRGRQHARRLHPLGLPGAAGLCLSDPRHLRASARPCPRVGAAERRPDVGGGGRQAVRAPGAQAHADHPHHRDILLLGRRLHRSARHWALEDGPSVEFRALPGRLHVHLLRPRPRADIGRHGGAGGLPDDHRLRQERLDEGHHAADHLASCSDVLRV